MTNISGPDLSAALPSSQLPLVLWPDPAVTVKGSGLLCLCRRGAGVGRQCRAPSHRLHAAALDSRAEPAEAAPPYPRRWQAAPEERNGRLRRGGRLPCTGPRAVQDGRDVRDLQRGSQDAGPRGAARGAMVAVQLAACEERHLRRDQAPGKV